MGGIRLSGKASLGKALEASRCTKYHVGTAHVEAHLWQTSNPQTKHACLLKLIIAKAIAPV